jgi:hypothetical protein
MVERGIWHAMHAEVRDHAGFRINSIKTTIINRLVRGQSIRFAGHLEDEYLTATWSKYRMMTGDTFPSPDAPGESRETEVVDALRPCAGIDDGGIDPEVPAPGMTPIAAQQRVKLTPSLVIVRAPPDLQMVEDECVARAIPSCQCQCDKVRAGAADACAERRAET